MDRPSRSEAASAVEARTVCQFGLTSAPRGYRRYNSKKGASAPFSLWGGERASPSAFTHSDGTPQQKRCLAVGD